MLNFGSFFDFSIFPDKNTLWEVALGHNVPDVSHVHWLFGEKVPCGLETLGKGTCPVFPTAWAGHRTPGWVSGTAAESARSGWPPFFCPASWSGWESVPYKWSGPFQRQRSPGCGIRSPPWGQSNAAKPKVWAISNSIQLTFFHNSWRRELILHNLQIWATKCWTRAMYPAQIKTKMFYISIVWE